MPALEWIQEGDFSTIPISPIDYITQRLESAGYTVAEVTGRTTGLDYAPNGSTTYKVCPDSERTPKARIDAVARIFPSATWWISRHWLSSIMPPRSANSKPTRSDSGKRSLRKTGLITMSMSCLTGSSSRGEQPGDLYGQFV